MQAEQDSDGSAQSTADMTAFVQNLLVQMVRLSFVCSALRV
uniref:Uncharacterized protein n=1 Tax=Aegilops tauschii subsp. strangulata TaxID=200361 RepID=A0A453RBL5_AEGTS